jgi:hypothetical protein
MRLLLEVTPSPFSAEFAEAVTTALCETGAEVVVREPVERRSLPLDQIGDIAVHLIDTATEHGVDVIAGAVAGALAARIRRRRTRGGRRPRVVIYGPDGTPLREVETPAPEDHSA